MITLRRTALLLGALTLTTGAATAQQQLCFTDSMPTTTTGWNGNLTFPRFDPNLGNLISVDFTLTGNAQGVASFESLDALPTTITTTFAATLTLTRPSGGLTILNVIPSTSFVNSATPFDGVIDFGGTSGATAGNIMVTDSNMTSLTSPADLALFSGPAGAPGTIVLPINAMGSSSGNGAGNLVLSFQQMAGASVEVCYTFALGLEKCDGDGGDGMGCTNCPCSNNAPSGTVGGCLNSVGTSARLLVSGVPSQMADTLQFKLSGATPGGSAVLFSSNSGAPTNPLNPCTGLDSGISTMFLDGLRCLGGVIRRHPTRLVDANGAVGVTGAPWGPPGGPPQGLIARGAWTPGQTTCWQAYYRDINGPCLTTVNTTNAIAITILP